MASNGNAKAIIAALAAALIAVIGAYFTLANGAISRPQMEAYVQTQSPFAKELPRFEEMEQEVHVLEGDVLNLKLHDQHQADKLDEILRNLRRVETKLNAISR